MALPRWISTANAASPPNNYIVEPIEAKKDVGFDAGEKIPAQYLNWYMSELEKSLRGTGTILIPASDGQPGGSAWVFTRDLVTLSGPPRWESPGTANRELVFPIRLSVGDRLLSVVAHVKGGSTTNLSMKVLKSVGTATAPTQLGSTQTTSGNTDQNLTVSGLTDTAADGEYFEVGFLSGATDTDQRVYAITVTFDRP